MKNYQITNLGFVYIHLCLYTSYWQYKYNICYYFKLERILRKSKHLWLILQGGVFVRNSYFINLDKLISRKILEIYQIPDVKLIKHGLSMSWPQCFRCPSLTAFMFLKNCNECIILNAYFCNTLLGFSYVLSKPFFQ